MKTVSVDLPDDVYEATLRCAAKNDTSIEAMMTAALAEVGERREMVSPADFERLQKLQNDVLASIEHFSVRNLLTRDELHDRRLFR